jgi:hypothetical protein
MEDFSDAPDHQPDCRKSCGNVTTFSARRENAAEVVTRVTSSADQ